MSSSSCIHSFVSYNLLLIPSIAFLKFQFVCFFNYLSLLYVFQLLVKIPLVFIHSSLEFIEHLHGIIFNSLLDRLLISTLFSYFSKVLSYPFIWNIFLCLLILPNCLCLFIVLGRLLMLPDLGGSALYRTCLMWHSSSLPSGHQRCML